MKSQNLQIIKSSIQDYLFPFDISGSIFFSPGYSFPFFKRNFRQALIFFDKFHSCSGVVAPIPTLPLNL
jgi:hypothetical protein